MFQLSGRALGRTLFVATAITIALVAPGSSASAHTDLESSVPAADSTVGAPVSEITLTFTEPVTPVANGFEVLDPQGNVTAPPFETTDDVTYVLALDPPLAGGDVGVRYEVTSADGHVVDGAFAFAVTAPPPTTAPTTAPPTTAPATAPPATAAPTVPSTAAPATDPPTTDTPPTSQPPVTTAVQTTSSIPTTTTVVVSATVADADDSGGSTTWWWVGGIAVVAIAAVGGAVAWTRSRG